MGEDATRLRAPAGEPRPGAALAVTVSVGCAALAPGEDGASLLARADARRYAAKAGGRDRVAP
jgi:PleD family two-component response regulator